MTQNKCLQMLFSRESALRTMLSFRSNQYKTTIMKQNIFSLLVLMLVTNYCLGQNLKSFSLNMQPSEEAYLGIRSKKAFSEPEMPDHKKETDLALLFVKEDAGSRIEWYNLSGKDDKIPEAFRGTNTRIIAISFDRQQFDKCKTPQDLRRMTGHLTDNSFSHFALLADGNTCEISNPCFVVQMENGKRALLWVQESVGCSFKVFVKSE